MVRRIDKIMASYVESKFDDELGLSFLQWVALKVVRDSAVTNAGELARELGITTGATTRMIDVLEMRGLMTRDRGTDDRRVVRLAITPEGRDIVEKLHGQVVPAWNEVLADFTQEEVDTLVELLLKLVTAAERVSGSVAQVRETVE
ncbi:MarR family winged helix-turn-helix transcriptional regulator [Sphingomonas sp. DT-204]|uniref:MarR family winged helix-turn-helix transcriptional regulator n=1 Tax=Sphingomonas sp. DT-204 TaxID=3396166 RepID=UPI003F1B5BF8